MFSRLISFFTPKKEWLFLPILYSLFIVYTWLVGQDFELHSFPKETISSATLDQYDIGLRVSTLYRSVFLLLFLFLAFILLFKWVQKKEWLSKYSFSLLNYLSFFSVAILFIHVVHGMNKYLLETLLIFQFFVLFQEFLFSSIYLKQSINQRKDLYVWSVILTLSLLFPVREYCSYTGIKFGVSLFYKLFFAFNLLIVNISYFLISRNKCTLDQLVGWTKPLVWLPFISLVSYELHIILTNRGLPVFTPINSYLLLLACIFFWFLTRFFIKKKYPYVARKEIAKHYAPILIFGIISFIKYSPFLALSNETFELANPANSLMRLMDFGEIPLVDFLSSHLLSEQLFSYIFTLFNGYSGEFDFTIYDFFVYSFSFVIIYYFFSFVFRNSSIAIVITLLFPFVYHIIPISYSIVLLSILLYYRLISKYSFPILLLSFAWVFFLLAWKAELGLSNLYLSAIFFIILLFKKFSKKLLFDYIKAGLVLLVLGTIVIVILSFSTDSNILVNFKKAFSYYTANQAHGLIPLSYDISGRYFKYHYFIFPVVILVSIFVTIPFFKNNRFSTIQFRILFSFLFLSIIYFVAAQRGLVRHNMFLSSMRFSSILFLMIGLIAVYYSWIKGLNYKGIVFIVTAILLVSNFAFPEKQNYQSPFESYVRKFIKYDKLWGSRPSKISRINGNGDFVELNFGGIQKFLDDNIDSTATFYDFSNTPMMYFYTKRKVPSYFNQIPICVINRELQEWHLNDLPRYNIPVAFMSNHPQNFWDRVDDVPNELRHILIANWLYKNYAPYAIINHHSTWVRLDCMQAVEENNEEAISVTKTLANAVIIPPCNSLIKKHVVARINTGANTSSTSEFMINNTLIYPHRLSYEGYQDVFIKDEWKDKPIRISSKDTIYGVELIKLNYCPDTISFRKREFQLKKLPFIEGQYSERVISKRIASKHSFLDKDKTVLGLDVPENEVRRTMQYIELITPPIEFEQHIHCQYGMDERNLGEFDFEIISTKDSARYHIPVYSQLNWHKFPIDYIIMRSTGNLQDCISRVSLINK